MKKAMQIIIVGLILQALVASSASCSILQLSTNYANAGDTAVVISMSLENTEPYSGAEMQIVFNPQQLTLNRIEQALRLADQDGFGYYEFTLGETDALFFDFQGQNLPADSGDILLLYFDVSPEYQLGRTRIEVSEITAVDAYLEYDSVTVIDGYIDVGSVCEYIVGDINNNGDANGVDVTYAVNYLKGLGPAPPNICYDCPSSGQELFSAGDVNGNCQFNGVDVTYYVNYLKGLGPNLGFCADCPPVVRKGRAVAGREIESNINAERIIAKPIKEDIPVTPVLKPVLKAKGKAKTQE